MNKLAVNLKVHLMNTSYPLLASIFFIVPVFLLFLFSFASPFFAGKVTIVALVTVSIFLYSMFLGALTPGRVMSYVVSLGSTRWSFYKGSVVFYIITSAVFSVIQVILFLLEGIIFKKIGVVQLNNYGFISGSMNIYWTFRLGLFHFFTLITVLSFFNLLGSIHLRLGIKFWIILFLSFVLVYNYTALGGNISVLFTGRNDFIMDLKAIINSSAAFALSWLFIRKAEIER